MQNVLTLHMTGVTANNEEEKWIDAAKQDPRAFEPLYNRYVKKIYAFIHCRVNDEDLVNDLCSQVFVKALTGLKSYTHKGFAFSSWLYRIAHNEVAGYYRKNPVSRYVSMDDSGAERLHAEIDASFELKEEIKDLYKLLGKLGSSEMELLQMRYFDDKSCAEIGEILDLQENTVRVKIFRVIQKLKSYK